LYHGQLVIQLVVGLDGVGAVALGEALFAQLSQIFEAVGLPLRQMEPGQVVVAELKIVAAAFGDLNRIVGGLAPLGKQLAHLLLALEIQLVAFKSHALGVVHGLAGLYAHEDVLIFPVVLFDIVGVVGDGQRYAGFLMYADKPGGGLLFLLQPVVLQLQIEVLRPEQGGELLRLGLGALVIAVSYHPGNGARDAAGEAYKPLVPCSRKSAQSMRGLM
jgi:hypothetical protein